MNILNKVSFFTSIIPNFPPKIIYQLNFNCKKKLNDRRRNRDIYRKNM
jgi:hypothetical protein